MSYISDLISHVTAKRGNVSEEITGRWQNNKKKKSNFENNFSAKVVVSG